MEPGGAGPEGAARHGNGHLDEPIPRRRHHRHGRHLPLHGERVRPLKVDGDEVGAVLHLGRIPLGEPYLSEGPWM